MELFSIRIRRTFQLVSTDYTIDFSEELSDCAREDYKESLAIHQTANILKAQEHV